MFVMGHLGEMCGVQGVMSKFQLAVNIMEKKRHSDHNDLQADAADSFSWA